MLLLFAKCIVQNLPKTIRKAQIKKCHTIFGVRELLQQDNKLDNVSVLPLTSEHHDMAVEAIKKYYLCDHVFVRACNMDLNTDRALDEYLYNLLKQGNSLFAKTESGEMAGFCINFACSPVDPKNLRNYAFYRQDPNTKDFLYFTAKLQETPNLWNVFKEQKVFEIKMLAVVPEYRRQGVATLLAEKAKDLAGDMGFKIVRMDCINPYDYKIAERCMLQCIIKFPLHKLRGSNTPFIKRTSELNRCVRVYVGTRTLSDTPDRILIMSKQADLENELCD